MYNYLKNTYKLSIWYTTGIKEYWYYSKHKFSSIVHIIDSDITYYSVVHILLITLMYDNYRPRNIVFFTGISMCVLWMHCACTLMCVFDSNNFNYSLSRIYLFLLFIDNLFHHSLVDPLIEGGIFLGRKKKSLVS